MRAPGHSDRCMANAAQSLSAIQTCSRPLPVQVAPIAASRYSAATMASLDFNVPACSRRTRYRKSVSPNSAMRAHVSALAPQTLVLRAFAIVILLRETPSLRFGTWGGFACDWLQGSPVPDPPIRLRGKRGTCHRPLCHTGLCTTPRHFRACHAVPMRWAAFAPLAAFVRRSCQRTRQYRQGLHTSMTGFLPGMRIPIPLQ